MSPENQLEKERNKDMRKDRSAYILILFSFFILEKVDVSEPFAISVNGPNS